MANLMYAVQPLLGAKLTDTDAPTTVGTNYILPHKPGTLVSYGGSIAGTRGIAIYAIAGAALTGSSSITVKASGTGSAGGTLWVVGANATVPANYGFWARTSAAFPV